MNLRLPRSLFGRTVVVLAACLVLSQLASLTVNFFDRGSSMYRLNSEQMAQRIARTASLLNRLPKEERSTVAQELGGRDRRGDAGHVDSRAARRRDRSASRVAGGVNPLRQIEGDDAKLPVDEDEVREERSREAAQRRGVHA